MAKKQDNSYSTTQNQRKKSLGLRIVMVILAVVLLLGLVVLPLIADAEEAMKAVEVTGFETGKLSDALKEAADGTDYNYIDRAAVSGGTLNAADYNALLSIPNLEYIELAGAETENGIIPENALASRNKLVYISLPSNTVEIGTRAFSNNKLLVKLDMPSSVEKIDEGAFEFCEALEKFPSSDKITFIGEGAFNSCKAFTEFYIPSGITEIYAYTFSKCGFSAVYIPASVTKIDDGAFSDCNNLKDIYVYGENTVVSGASAFQNVSATVHVSKDNADNYKSWTGNNISTSDDLTETDAPKASETEPNDVYTEDTGSASTEETTIAETTVKEDETTASSAETTAVSENTAKSGVSVAAVVIIAVCAAAAAVAVTVVVMKKKK